MPPQGYVDDRTYFYFTFNGSNITHYNVSFTEEGGRRVQYEVATLAGSNKSRETSLKGIPGSRYQVSVQACARITIKAGPFSVGTNHRAPAGATSRSSRSDRPQANGTGPGPVPA